MSQTVKELIFIFAVLLILFGFKFSVEGIME